MEEPFGHGRVFLNKDNVSEILRTNLPVRRLKEKDVCEAEKRENFRDEESGFLAC